MASAVPQASQIGSKVGLLFGDTWDCIGVDFDAEKCHSLLNYKGFPTAFQADDEGSIPFTRFTFKINNLVGYSGDKSLA